VTPDQTLGIGFVLPVPAPPRGARSQIL